MVIVQFANCQSLPFRVKLKWKVSTIFHIINIIGPIDLLINKTAFPHRRENRKGTTPGYPLINKHSYGKWTFIVDFPIENGDFL